MRKGTKSDLYDVFETINASSKILKESVCVIDGGWLLHQVQWPHSKTFRDICDLYVSYIHRHFPEAYIVFDGYSNENVAVKTYERFRRNEKNFAPDVNINMDLMVLLTREKFLANIANKHKFINLLTESLRQSNIHVEVANGDADTLIVTTAIELKNRVSKSVVVVGNDVDLIVLLVGLTSPGTIIYFYKMGSGKTESRVYDTHSNQLFKDFILFVHAFSGCDSTSALFNKGKKRLVKLFLEDAQLTDMIKPFYSSNSEKRILYEVAEKIIFQLYLSNNTKEQPTTIAELRYYLFNQTIFHNNKESSLATLPPTQAALLEHTKRVYLQVQEWLGKNMDAEEWGWKRIFQIIMYPVMTTAPPAPDVLLEQVRCSCTDCSSSRCTCKKSGIRCTQLCKNCEGNACENKAIQPAEQTAEICEEEENNDELEAEEYLEEESETEEQIEEELDHTNTAEPMEIDFDNY
ncbi:uncharacterized protein [Chelonus insularis]|uniref:uncharacterized protein isoform X2 n=1 Tax=Chelonus insularis TaxID=460826 RepID=UPI001588859D|nr:uncharacterized protein LOC118072244 isoform X2 [Chelonus insularis]